MSRWCGHPVDVIRRDAAPGQFLWRGRLYLVREVLDHWTRSGAWWDGAAARAVLAGEGTAREPELNLAPIASSPRWAQRAWGEPAPEVGTGVGPLSLGDVEQEFWRVEAAAGRSAQPGVYDLCLDSGSDRWSLSRVSD